MKKLPVLAVASLLAACSGESPDTGKNAVSAQDLPAINAEVSKIQYPQTRKDDVVDSYFDIDIADPYRWLEDDRSEETEAWVKAQNKVTFSYLDQIPYRESLKQRLE